MTVAPERPAVVPAVASLTFWPTSWAKLLPGDVVKAPDDSWWEVGASIECGDEGEWLITPLPGSRWTKPSWTKHALDDGVVAARPPAPSRSEDVATAIGLLRLAGFEVGPA